MRIRTFIILAVLPLLAGCGSSGTETLLFGQTDKIGVGVATGAVSQGVDAHLGYKGLNVARVPVVTKQTAEDGGEELVQLGGLLTGKKCNTDKPKNDRVNKGCGAGVVGAFSVLGQFEGQAGAGKASLGKYFTTGLASRQLADGYRAKYESKQP